MGPGMHWTGRGTLGRLGAQSPGMAQGLQGPKWSGTDCTRSETAGAVATRSEMVGDGLYKVRNGRRGRYKVRNGRRGWYKVRNGLYKV